MNEIEWSDDPDPAEWDRVLANLGGHPLQSAIWGDARRVVDGIRDHRWMALHQGVPVWMARLEERRIPAFGCIVWVPKGPTGGLPDNVVLSLPTISERLKRLGAALVVTDPWKAELEKTAQLANSSKQPKTIWVDIELGRDRLWQNLDKQWRYGVRRAERVGVTVEHTRSASDIEQFFALCANISQVKGFRLPASIELMKQLLASEESGSAEARLFVARYQGQLGAGAFVIRCGTSVHYFWGATDRALAKQRVGEAVQWAVIEWALSKNCQRYDLEGIDPQGNPGVYEFKRKMGGRETILTGKRYFPIGIRGKLLSQIDAWLH